MITNTLGRRAQLLLLLACVSQSPNIFALDIITGPTLTMDPNSATPNAGVIELQTDEPTRVTISVSADGDTFYIEFPSYQTTHAVPLLGLKPDSSYAVNVMVTNQGSKSVHASGSLLATTVSLPADFPAVSLQVNDPANMEPGFTLLDLFSRGRGATAPGYSMIVNNAGEVIWYSTMGASAMKQLSNGNLRYRAASTAVEIDMLGNVVQSTQLLDPGLGLHHDLVETAHDTFLSLSRATVSVPGFPTSDIDPNAPVATADVRDEPVVEFLPDGSVLNNWPLINVLDPARIGYDSLRPSSAGFDWVHTNAVIHDPSDDSLIVSVRHQDAVIKISRTNGNLIWILGNPDNWSPFFDQFLLQPTGQPFEWQYHQHAMMITPAGTLLMYDNGNYRASPFDGTTPLADAETYSRIVEYAINEQNMTVSQVREFGSQLAMPLFSGTRGDADWLPNTGNVLITSADISFEGGLPSVDMGFGERHARITEIDDSPTPQVVFDLRIHDPAGGRIGIYRSERIPGLYPSSVAITGPFPPLQLETSWAANDVCFEYDNDGDGIISEDGGTQLVDDDADGLIDEDPAECPGGTSGGTRLPDDGVQNYFLASDASGYNPAEVYSITSARINANADVLGIGSFYATCDAFLDLNGNSGDYVAMLVLEHPDGTLELVQNAQLNDANVSGQLSAQNATLQWSREFHPGEIVHLYVDFQKGQQSAGNGYCYNFVGGSLAINGEVSNSTNNYAGLLIGP